MNKSRESVVHLTNCSLTKRWWDGVMDRQLEREAMPVTWEVYAWSISFRLSATLYSLYYTPIITYAFVTSVSWGKLLWQSKIVFMIILCQLEQIFCRYSTAINRSRASDILIVLNNFVPHPIICLSKLPKIFSHTYVTSHCDIYVTFASERIKLWLITLANAPVYVGFIITFFNYLVMQ